MAGTDWPSSEGVGVTLYHNAPVALERAASPTSPFGEVAGQITAGSFLKTVLSVGAGSTMKCLF